MLNRRHLMGSIAGMTAVTAFAGAEKLPSKTSDIWGSDADAPNAKVVRGYPNVLDFGNGLKIPFDKRAFLALWEGPNFWLTYGFGRGRSTDQANEQAVKGAAGTMQVMLLTLAFEPDRLICEDGGWRLKDQNLANYVRGYLELPGRPFAPIADTKYGFGNLEGAAPSMMLQPSTPAGPGGGGGWSQPYVPLDSTGPNRISAFTNYILRKKDVDLAYVRDHAQLLPR
ncbi:MAG: hypothetical protein P4L57_08295 [Rhizomicrobium sp.]|nr:hypothetical protein [Rhizomicrobium sp.]